MLTNSLVMNDPSDRFSENIFQDEQLRGLNENIKEPATRLSAINTTKASQPLESDASRITINALSLPVPSYQATVDKRLAETALDTISGLKGTGEQISMVAALGLTQSMDTLGTLLTGLNLHNIAERVKVSGEDVLKIKDTQKELLDTRIKERRVELNQIEQDAAKSKKTGFWGMICKIFSAIAEVIMSFPNLVAMAASVVGLATTVASAVIKNPSVQKALMWVSSAVLVLSVGGLIKKGVAKLGSKLLSEKSVGKLSSPITAAKHGLSSAIRKGTNSSLGQKLQLDRGLDHLSLAYKQVSGKSGWLQEHLNIANHPHLQKIALTFGVVGGAGAVATTGLDTKFKADFIEHKANSAINDTDFDNRMDGLTILSKDEFDRINEALKEQALVLQNLDAKSREGSEVKNAIALSISL